MKERWRVVKAVKPSGNSGSVYVPREWIGQSVEISLYSAEAIVLEALYPHVESILGIYLYGPHAKGMGTPEQDVDVLVITDKSIPIENAEGINCTVIALEKVGEYAKANQAEYSEIVCEAFPVMNELLLAHLKNYIMGDEALTQFIEGLDSSLSIAGSLAQEGDYASAAYALMQRLKDYSVLSSGGIFNYGKLEEYACGKGIDKERFKKLYEAYLAQGRDYEPTYKASMADVEALSEALKCLKSEKEPAKTETVPEEKEESDANEAFDYAKEMERIKRSLEDPSSGGAP
jgi:hypothetical protein